MSDTSWATELGREKREAREAAALLQRSSQADSDREAEMFTARAEQFWRELEDEIEGQVGAFNLSLGTPDLQVNRPGSGTVVVTASGLEMTWEFSRAEREVRAAVRSVRDRKTARRDKVDIAVQGEQLVLTGGDEIFSVPTLVRRWLEPLITML